MVLDAHILSKSQHNELSTLHHIHRGDTSIEALSKQLSIPKNTIKSYIYRLNDAFCFYLGLPDYLQASYHGVISIQDNYKKNSSHYFNQIKLKYLKQSHEFNILVSLATCPTTNMHSLTEKLVLSRSYVARLIKKFNKKSQLFGFEIVEYNESLHFKGNEVAIRLYLYLLLSDSFQVIEWPFENLKPEKLQYLLPITHQKSNTHISQTKKTFILMLVSILQNRLKQNQILPIPSKNVTDIFTLIQQNFDVTTEFPMIVFDEANIENQTNEKYYFNFFIRIFVPDTIPAIENIQLGEVFAHSNLKVTNFALELTERIEQTLSFSFSKTDKYLFVYYLTVLCTFYQIFGDSCTDFLYLRFQPKQIESDKNEMYKLIESVFHEVCSTFFTSLILPSLGDPVDSYFSQTIYHLVDMSLNAKIMIYIQLSQEFTAEAFVTKKLKTFFNSDYISITNDFSKADLLITDTAELLKEQIVTYHMNSLVDPNQWSGLLSLINKLILEKFFITQ